MTTQPRCWAQAGGRASPAGEGRGNEELVGVSASQPDRTALSPHGRELLAGGAASDEEDAAGRHS
eukprot:15438583-Alexandrium_andersonii.AAC.1